MADKVKDTEKPLEKMTAVELRELAKTIPEITGVHGMKKAELLAAIIEAQGTKEKEEEAQGAKEKEEEAQGAKEKEEEAQGAKEKEEVAPAPKAVKPAGGLKEKIRALKAARREALASKDKKMAKIYRRRISRLKKKTRKAA